MNIGYRIIEEIGKGAMFATHDVDGPIERSLIYVWSSGAAEQLEAVVHQYTDQQLASVRNDLRLSQGAYDLCNMNLKNALAEIKEMRTRLSHDNNH